jgi:hypothetical protein
MIRQFILWCKLSRWLGHVTFNILSPTSFEVSWDTNYSTTWSIVSTNCLHSPIHISNGTSYEYHMRTTLHDCDCLKTQNVVLRNDDLSIWAYYDDIDTNCTAWYVPLGLKA